MATYKSGSANLKSGSAIVVGNGTEWNVYTSAGQLFKLESEATFYEIGAVNSATNISLTARYTNAAYQTTRLNEHVATTNVGSKVYSGNLLYTPAIQNTVVINASYDYYTDDGAGNLTATSGGSGVIDYDTGVFTIIQNATHNASLDVTASYKSGDEMNGMQYNIFTDYTTYYNIPEMSTGDRNFQHIFTRAVRKIDSSIANASVVSIKSSQDMEVTASAYGLILKSPDGTRWRLNVTNTGTVNATTV